MEEIIDRCINDNGYGFIASGRCRGRVAEWVAQRGFGFITPDGQTGKIFVHVSKLRPEACGRLAPGDVVEFHSARGKVGLDALDVSVVDRGAREDAPDPFLDPLAGLQRFADIRKAMWLEELAGMVEAESWRYGGAPAFEPLPILRNYFSHTFRRLEETGGIKVSEDEQAACFNTGLLTPLQEDLVALFQKNARHCPQPWRFDRFCTISDRRFLSKFGATIPPLASYFEDPSVLVYDRRCKLIADIPHILQNIRRFPKEIQDNLPMARQLLTGAIDAAERRAQRNYKSAVPQFYRHKGGPGKMQLLLPICLSNPAKVDLALAVERHGDTYRGNTVLTLDMAYTNARLLARLHEQEWLRP